MKFFSKCETCQKTRWMIKHRTLNPLPIGVRVKSDAQICGKCFRVAKKWAKIHDRANT